MTDPIHGVSLEQFADISARMVGLATAEEAYAVAQAAGLDRSTWEAVNTGWTERLGSGDQALVAEHRRFLIAALERLAPGQGPMSFDQYVELNALFQSGVPPAEAVARFGYTMQGFSAGSYAWMDRLAEDARLNTYFGLRVAKAVAEKTGEAPREVCYIHAPGTRVRARRCHKCGAIKATKPRTAYVYCDYCATLFDYEPFVSIQEDPTELDSNMVDAALDTATREDLKAALQSGDRDEYYRTVLWKTEVLTELCPRSYSPRIRDPKYRKAFNEKLIAPWAVATAFDPQVTDAGRAFDQAMAKARETHALPDVLHLLECAKKCWQEEAELFERLGIMAAHPDGLDTAGYLYANAAFFVRPWVHMLEPADHDALLQAAGVACDYMPMPEVQTQNKGCGQCGQQLLIPVGSHWFVCESCGHVLAPQERSFACKGCGGEVCLPPAATEAVCGHCDTRWTL